MKEAILDLEEDAKIQARHIKSFYKYNGSVYKVILFILSNLDPDKFTTSRWIRSKLEECGIKRELREVTAQITLLKKEGPATKKERGKTLNLIFIATIESVDICEGSNLIDLPTSVDRRFEPNTMIRINDYGRKQVKEIIKENKQYFKD